MYAKKPNSRKLFVGLSAIALIAATAYAYALKNDHWGPYVCNSCMLSTPLPDAATKSFIKRSDMGFIVVPGDSITVCGPTACVTYTKSSSGDFQGGPVVPITNGNPGGGGAGDSPGGGGGTGAGGGSGPIGSGCQIKCNGVITVGA